MNAFATASTWPKPPWPYRPPVAKRYLVNDATVEKPHQP